MKILLSLGWMNDGTLQNHVGDHSVAIGWQKYLGRRSDVASCEILGPRTTTFALPDVAIHFHHWLPLIGGTKNFYYLQNSFPRQAEWPNGTVGVFQDHRKRYDGFLFASERLKAACDAPGVVLPFAVDPEVFCHQTDERFNHPYCYTGNDIKGRVTDDRYLVPFITQGLVLYGGPRQDPRLEACRKGRLSAEDLPKVYSSAQVNLNYWMPIAEEMGVHNMRAYELAACKARWLSDAVPEGFLCQPRLEERDPYKCVMTAPECIEHNYREVLARHTWAHRMETLVAWLGDVL